MLAFCIVAVCGFLSLKYISSFILNFAFRHLSFDFTPCVDPSLVTGLNLAFLFFYNLEFYYLVYYEIPGLLNDPLDLMAIIQGGMSVQALKKNINEYLLSLQKCVVFVFFTRGCGLLCAYLQA